MSFVDKLVAVLSVRDDRGVTTKSIAHNTTIRRITLSNGLDFPALRMILIPYWKFTVVARYPQYDVAGPCLYCIASPGTNADNPSVKVTIGEYL